MFNDKADAIVKKKKKKIIITVWDFKESQSLIQLVKELTDDGRSNKNLLRQLQPSKLITWRLSVLIKDSQDEKHVIDVITVDMNIYTNMIKEQAQC